MACGIVMPIGDVVESAAGPAGCEEDGSMPELDAKISQLTVERDLLFIRFRTRNQERDFCGALYNNYDPTRRVLPRPNIVTIIPFVVTIIPFVLLLTFARYSLMIVL
jgi:hypothetical protein